MKFKINAGAEIDLLTAKEMRSELDGVMTSWFAEVAQGDRYRPITGYADSNGAGLILVGDGPNSERIGPQEGFMWSIRSLAICSGYDPTDVAQGLALYRNSPDSASGTVHPRLDLYNSFDAGELVLHSGDTIVVSGTGEVSTRVWVTGQVRELPVSLGWRLG